jgi:hypothetical protein
VWFFIFMSGKKERKKMNRFLKNQKINITFTIGCWLVDLGVIWYGNRGNSKGVGIW